MKHNRSPRAIGTLMLIAACLILSACASLEHNAAPASYIQIGDTLALKQTLKLGKGARQHIQNGELRAFDELDVYEPYCYFFLHRNRADLNKPYTIDAQQFTVAAIRRENDGVWMDPYHDPFYFFPRYHYYPRAYTDPWRHRTPGFRAHPAFLRFEYGEQTFETILVLKSGPQPEVRSVVCSVFATPYDRSYVSSYEIRQTLGELVEIRRP